MAPKQEIVITGTGVVSPIGIGTDAFWSALVAGRSGIKLLKFFEEDGGGDMPVPFGGKVDDFDPKQYIRPRKSLKVMSRDIQFAFAAADMACAEAGFHNGVIDPERLGIVFGSELIPCEPAELVDAYLGCMTNGKFDFSLWGKTTMEELFPLWMLKYLPNMPACHIGIAQDARGPNNSLTLGDVSSLSAVAEAVRVIERGHADAMIAGGAGSRVHPSMWGRNEMFDTSHRSDDPAAASRPFDARRDGMIGGEGAGAFVLETRRHAESRGAEIIARILGYASAFEPARNGQPLQGNAVRLAIAGALRDAELDADEIGHVNAHGNSTTLDDRIEAAAIRQMLGDVPVTAPKSFFGNHGAGSGAVEAAASILAFRHGEVPPTLNYEYPDPKCPINVIHGRPMKIDCPTALVLNHTQFGQAVAVLLAGP